MLPYVIQKKLPITVIHQRYSFTPSTITHHSSLQSVMSGDGLRYSNYFLCTSWIHTIIRKELFVQWFKYKSHINASSYINLPAEQYLTSYNFHIHILVKCSPILFVYIHLQCILFLYPLFVVTPLNLFNQQ